MMNGPISPARTDRVFWVFVVLVVVIFLFLGIGVTFAQTVTATKVVGAVATPPQLAAFEAVLFDRIERRRLECGRRETVCGWAATGD